jgi:hypothetical protein
VGWGAGVRHGVAGVYTWIQLQGGQWPLLGGNNNDSVAAHDSWCPQGHERQQGILIRASDGHNTDRLVDFDGCTVKHRLLHGPAKLVGICAPVKQALDAEGHLLFAVLAFAASHLLKDINKLRETHFKIFGNVVHDLCTIVSSALAPARGRSVGGFNSIANVFAVAVWNVCEDTAIVTQHFAGVWRIWPLLTPPM